MTNQHQGLVIEARLRLRSALNVGGSIRRFAAMKWLEAVKLWESADSIAAAYAESRLTLRAFGDNAPDRVIKDLSTSRVYSNDDYERKDQLGEYWALELKSHHYIYNTSQFGIRQRLDPSNFGKSSQTRLKYVLGLHDVSTTLINPEKKIIDQLHTKTDTHCMFFPLTEQEDQQLFWLLAQQLKSSSDNDDQQQLNEFRSKLTRVQIADSADQATGFSAFLRDDEGFKLKYTLPEGSNSLKFQIERKIKALNYQTLLKDQRGLKSELVLAVRHHGNPDFPIFVRYESPGKWLRDRLEFRENQWQLTQTAEVVFDDPQDLPPVPRRVELNAGGGPPSTTPGPYRHVRPPPSKG